MPETQWKKTVTIEDTKGNQRKFLRWGEFRFRINNTDCTLQAYKGSADEERFFIPFRVTTSGKETYGAGRCLDLEAEGHIDIHIFLVGSEVLFRG